MWQDVNLEHTNVYYSEDLSIDISDMTGHYSALYAPGTQDQICIRGTTLEDLIIKLEHLASGIADAVSNYKSIFK